MRHIPHPRGGELAAMRVYSGPNLVVLSRANRPPIPTLDADEREEKAAGEAAIPTGAKSVLRGRSKKSSLNLARVLSSLDWKRNGQCLHVTLSYWRWWPKSKEELASAKAGIVARVGERVLCGIWSLEYQTERFAKYGEWVPHWHLLVWIGDNAAERVEYWFRNWWLEFGRNDSEHGVHVTSGDQARGTWYLAMHAAKAAQSPPFAVGRWWGYIRREQLLGAQDVHCVGEATDREAVWWARIFRRQNRLRVRQRGKCAQGLSWFLPRAAQCDLGAWIRDQIESENREKFRPKNPF